MALRAARADWPGAGGPRLLIEGWSNARIAAALVIAPQAVAAHVEHILAKLGAGAELRQVYAGPGATVLMRTGVACRPTGAAADHARFRVQLLVENPDLLALADAAFEPIGAIHHAADRAELVEHDNRCQKAFITAAGAQVR
ncbi:MAG: LuxR C-terminal-related transcriptional regulator [Pseudonocardiaceae bacterium]